MLLALFIRSPEKRKKPAFYAGYIVDYIVRASPVHRTDPGVSSLLRILYKAYPLLLLLLFSGPWFAFGLISERKPRCHSSYLCM